MNLDPILSKNIKEVRKELEALREDNAYLRGLYEKKCSELEQMEMRMEDIKVENDRLL
jgi:predicted nuclease with TOPRIM domain